MSATGNRATNNGDDPALTRFDATAASTFAVLCHLTVGDHVASERLLADVYIGRGELAVSTDAATALTLRAHQVYLADAADTADTGSPRSVHILANLTPAERVALSLAEIEHQTLPTIAQVLGVDGATAEVILDAARGAASVSILGESVRDAFRHTEVWMDDGVQQRVRAALETSVGRANESLRRSATRRSRYAVRSAAAVAGIALAGGAVWAVTSPGTSPTSAVPRVTTITMAADLTDSQSVRPDSIVRFSNGHIGLTWRGDCNRPAASVEVVSTKHGVGIKLETGAFPVVSCVGMPTRWSAVVDPANAKLGKGPILPLLDASTLDTAFSSYSAAAAPENDGVSTSNDRDVALTSSLLDAQGHPWTFVTDCRRLRNIAYASPNGPLFESRLTEIGRACASEDNVPRLVSTDGTRFPHTDGGTPAGATDCEGPAGSATDLAYTQPLTTIVGDGHLSTWDGCRVRSGVIFTTPLPAVCGWRSARTITFARAIGEPMGSSTLTFIRDPQHVVPGERAPLLFYTDMPVKAHDTGIRFDTDQLWLSPDNPDALYVVTSTGVERWPLFTGTAGCSGASS